MKKFRNRLTIVFVLFISLSIGVLGVFVSHLLERSYMSSLSDRITKEAQLLANTVEWHSDIEKMDHLASMYGEMLDTRITFIAADGEVLGDSESDPRTMENHADRPEFREAVQPSSDVGEAIRYSVTVETQLIYIAVPVVRNTEIVGVVRLAESLAQVNASVRQIGVTFVAGLLLLLAFSGIVSFRLARGITRPIEEMTEYARGISRGDFQQKAVHVNSDDELGQLARSINHMSQSLQTQLAVIRESERRLQSVIETMPSGMLLIDDAGKVTLLNQAMRQMLRLIETDVTGKPYKRMTNANDLSKLVDQCFSIKRNVREEIQLFVPEKRVFEASLSPIMDDNQHVKAIVVILHDITAIRRLEQMRSEFVANVSHEIKTPITSVIGFTETLLDGAMADEETLRSFLEIILEESKRLYRLIGDILDLSKIESGELPLTITNIDVSHLIHSVAHTLQDQVSQNHLRLHLHAPDRLRVASDEDRLRQIVVNLLTNAITHTPTGGRIDITVKSADDEWQLLVADTGVGMTKADLSRIFERFYRVDKARSRESGGTGLGLAIVKHLVDVLHGSIEVDSEVGVGTTFTLTFPIHQETHGS